MAVKNTYSRARATKKSNSIKVSGNLSNKEKNKAVNKILKSPILILAMLFLIIGAAGGFFAFKILSPFEMNAFLVNGVESANTDYVVIDVSSIKEEYLKTNNEATMEDVYNSINLQDNLVECKFFGIDVSNTVSIKYYYREDISKDVVEKEGVDVEIPGVYYVEYTSNHFAFKNKTLIRTIVVMEVENDG